MSKISLLASAAISGLLMVGMSSAAHAATLTYDFTQGNSDYSTTKQYMVGGVTLTVSANTVSDNGGIVTPVIHQNNTNIGVAQFNGLGLAIMNSSNDNSHTIDGYGLNDLLGLSFSSEVKVIGATFSYLGQQFSDGTGLKEFAFFADPDKDGSVAGDEKFLRGLISAVGSTGSYNFTTDLIADIFSKTYGIAAIYDQNCPSSSCKFQSFKLSSITVNTVPLPTGIILLLSGLAGIGAVGRMRRKGRA